MESADLTIMELEPIPTAGLRATATKVQETVLGKRNRIGIGHPLIRSVTNPNEAPLLREQDIAQFPLDAHRFFVIEPMLTLLPDSGCRFRSVDFFVEVSPAQGDLPLVLRLSPEEEITKKSVEASREASAKLGLTDNLLHVLDVGAEESSAHREQWEAISIHLESFGAQMPQAGWRMRVTESRDIPINTRGLQLLCVAPAAGELAVEFRVVAELEILTAVDRWMTMAFRRKNDPEVSLRFAIK
jgi:hypothetical protein